MNLKKRASIFAIISFILFIILISFTNLGLTNSFLVVLFLFIIAIIQTDPKNIKVRKEQAKREREIRRREEGIKRNAYLEETGRREAQEQHNKDYERRNRPYQTGLEGSSFSFDSPTKRKKRKKKK